MGLNKIVLMGRLTRDPELRYTQSGTAVASFTVAVDREFSKEKATDFINCTAWRNTGEFISKYFTKGEMIAVSGRLQMRDYEAKDGSKRTAAEVNVESAYFCGGKGSESSPEVSEPAFTDISDEDDGELPF